MMVTARLLHPIRKNPSTSPHVCIDRIIAFFLAPARRAHTFSRLIDSDLCDKQFLLRDDSAALRIPAPFHK
jgi:hypothetical protein